MKKRKKPRTRPTPKAKRKPKLERKDIRLDELKEVLDRARTSLSAEDVDKLEAAVDTLAWLTTELEAKGASIVRLRKLLFGASTEKTSRVVGKNKSPGPSGDKSDEPKPKPKRKGHGRNGAADYRGAERKKVSHGTLRKGDPCPACKKGKVYPLQQPATMVRVTGMAPLQATVYECERLRCNLCGEVFTAKAPAGVGEDKYDETAAAMIGLLKYGCGLPFNRLERLERDLGIPLPASTQWEVVNRAAGLLGPAFRELLRQAAQGELVHTDDTVMKILELGSGTAAAAMADEDDRDDRTGVFTSGIVATAEGHRIALFFTGRKHAGENLAKVLAEREAGRSPPIQMCDGLSWNTAGDFETIVANCIAHARRNFVEVADNFPDECAHVLLELKKVYENEATAKARGLSPEERLSLHQAESEPVMTDLEEWLQGKLDRREVEPNSTLGDAINYMLNHWDELTLFLREPGAPLDNNICERALKKAILHRKNSLFYKTQNGARVGDLFMSMIHTAELGGVDPFDYIVTVQRHAEAVADAPADWMPWNYKATVDRLAPSA